MESPPLSATDRVTLKSRGGAAELQEISVFILERFYDRGVTLEEAHAVVESGNEDAALELLGMNAREARRLYDRYAAALDRA